MLGEINVSVRGIVEFVLRSGSIDSGYMSQSRLQDGIRIHQIIQRRRKKEAKNNGMSYESEVRLKAAISFREIIFNISGIADGILLAEENGVIIEEIKSTTKDIDEISEDETHWHTAQAKCYGYMYCLLWERKKIGINLTYCGMEGDYTRTFSYEFTAEQLKDFFYDLLDKYYRWAELEYNRISLRNKSVKEAQFPFVSYRKGQREFAIMTYRAIQNGKKVYIEAPTGTGKTISALFPAVKALGEGFNEKIFYLTAKTITRQAAKQAADMLIEKSGCNLSYIVITAKDKICFLSERVCDSSVCSFAAGHFDRVNAALWVTKLLR